MRYVAGIERIIVRLTGPGGPKISEKEPPAGGVILNVGPGVTYYRAGDRVAWGKYSGCCLHAADDTILVLRVDEILCRVELDDD